MSEKTPLTSNSSNMAGYSQLPQAGYPPAGAPGYPPGGQGYPPGGQGYPPGGQGYPPAGQGYPPAGQGYPPAGQGYQQGGQGYPPAGQGYPPNGQQSHPLTGSTPGYPTGAPGYPSGHPGGDMPQGGPNSGPVVPMYKGEMPAEDVKDDEHMKAPLPTAPPISLMDQLPGYGNTGFEGVSLPPPSYEDVVREPPQREDVRGVAAITEEQARDALIQFVSEHCCYGKGPAVGMKFEDMQASSAFHYKLETYGEARSTKWTCEPFTGKNMVVVSGPPPGPWQISVTYPELFKTKKLDVEVPNTSSIKPCHGGCFASGYKRCYRCHGRGQLRCNWCNGSGRKKEYCDGEWRNTDCDSCHHGRKRCYTCHGYGQVTCDVCKGRASVRWYILLTVKWTNHVEDHIVERTALPDKLIRDAKGQVAFEETQPRVWPVNHFPVQDINTASNNLVTSHSTKFPTERLLMQRHQVRIIPVTQVHYKYKDDHNSFFVYGFEHKVHAPDYPAKCCCGCTVL